MSVDGQRPFHSKLTTHWNIFCLKFDSRPKQHTRSLNERVTVETTGIEKEGANETDDFVCRNCVACHAKLAFVFSKAR